jgi:hypothetical protein
LSAASIAVCISVLRRRVSAHRSRMAVASRPWYLPRELQTAFGAMISDSRISSKGCLVSCVTETVFLHASIDAVR